MRRQGIHTKRVKRLSHKRYALLWFTLFAVPSILASFLACTEAEHTYYTGARVNFTYTYTNTVPELNTALGSMGEFCTIRCDGANFIFSGLKSSTSRPLTAVDTRVKPALGLSGLIVGLPNMPELGASEPRVVAFDLACPCYDEFDTTRNLQMKSGGHATCSRCGRTYDLNNLGVVSQGPAGRSLYRYRASYNQFGYTLSVNN